MGRSKAKINYPSIPALMGLMEWYAAVNQLPKRWNISESKYVELLSEQLVKDKILPNPSKNLVYKLLGNPPQSKLELTDAFEEETLEKLSRFTIEKDNPRIVFEEGMCWKKIQSYYFPMPQYLESLQAAGYFKFLNEKEKQLMRGYVKIRLSSLIDAQAVFYSVFMWSTVANDFIGGVLAFSPGEFAWASGFKHILFDEEHLRSDLMSGFLRMQANELSCMLFSEDATSQSSMYFAIKTSTMDMPADFLSGICTYRRVNGELGTSKVILSKEGFYETAKGGSHFPGEADDLRAYLRNSSMEFKSKDNYFLEHHMRPTNPRLFPINGSYACGFIIEPKTELETKKLYVGLCILLPNGSATFSFPSGDSEGYISNYSPNLQNISIQSYDTFDIVQEGFNLELKVERSVSDTFAKYLDGYFTAYLFSEPIGGRIVFVNSDKYSKSGDIQESFEEQENRIVKVYEIGGDITERYALDILERLTVSNRSLWKHSIHYPVNRIGS